MNAALPVLQDAGSLAELVRSFTASVTDWTDTIGVGEAAAATLHAQPGCVSATVLRLEPLARSMLVIGAAGQEPTAAPGDRIATGEGILASAIRCDEAVRAGIGELTELAVPIRTGIVCHGVILMRSAGDPELTSRLADAAAVIAAPLGAALEVVAATSADVVVQLQQQLQEHAAIVEVGQAVTSALTVDEILTVLAYSVEALLSAQCAAIALRREGEDEELVLQTTTGALLGSEGRAFPLEGSLPGWVARTGETAVSGCMASDPRGEWPEAPRGPGVAVPILSHGQYYGVLLAARAEGAPAITDHEAETTSKMAAYAGIALENARLYREQKEAAATLREQAHELQRAYADLSDSQQQLLISEKMAALGRITAGIAHEINSPLGSILNALKMARNYVEEYRESAGDPEVTREDHHAIADDLQNTINLADTATQKVAQFVRSIKNQTRASGEEDLALFNVPEEIDAVVVLLQHELRKQRVAVFTDMERGLQLRGDRGKFGVVLQNLLRNAIDAFDSSGGEVWIRLHRQESSIRLEVEDHGSGIPEEIQGRIFDYLFTTKGVGKGTGLGLSMVHSVVTTHFSGEISFRSEVGKGTTFTLTFPTTTDGE